VNKTGTPIFNFQEKGTLIITKTDKLYYVATCSLQKSTQVKWLTQSQQRKKLYIIP
jgi:hypothetical protein